MSSTLRRAVLAGIAALAAAFAAAAATVSSPYRPSASPAMAARLSGPGQEALDLETAALLALRIAGAGPIRVEGFPVAPGVLGNLVLERFEILAADARITVSGTDGDSDVPFPSVAHFSGKIEGEADSTVYLAAQPDRLIAYVQSGAGRAYAGPDESGAGFVVRMADSPLNEAQLTETWSCESENLPAALLGIAEPTYPAAGVPRSLALLGLKQAAIRIETDQELLAKYPGGSTAEKIANMSAWITTLYGAINVIYERDLSLHLAISEIHVWTTPDPYGGASTLDQLMQLGTWWHGNRPTASYPRTFVHYLSGRPVSGGIAWISVLCAGDFPYGNDWGGAYGLTQVYGTYPLQFWDQLATSHEMGHNVASPHTHCYVPAIDHCYNQEGGCYNGVVEPPAGGGTIMSYCHLNYGSNLVFHARCIDETMVPAINSASCLTEASTFLDVPPSHPFYSFIETLAANGVTGGCGGAYFCPDASVTRAQMAVFLLKSKFGSGYAPPAATGGVFADVPANAFAAAWIEALANLGITGGCGGGNYCPGGSVSRKQMSTFLLKAKYGSGHVPPVASGVFADVPMSDSFAAWIEELYSETITGGCMTNPLRYCPNNLNTRGQMAVFLVKTFNLQ